MFRAAFSGQMLRPLAVVTLLLVLNLFGRADAGGDTSPGTSISTPAEGASGTAALDELVAAALESNPSLAAQRERVAASAEMISPAGALPDPVAELMFQDIDFPSMTIGEEDMSMVGVQVKQGLLYPGKRQARRQAAQAELSVRSAELEQLKRTIAAQVRTLYARLYALDHERQSLEAARDLLEMLSATIASRYTVGQAEQEAVVKAQLAGSRLEERLSDLTAERSAVVAAMNRWLDRPGDYPIGEVAALPEISLPDPAWGELALKNASEVSVRRAAVGFAEHRLQAARTELNPNFELGFGVFSREEKDHVFTLQLGAELPLWKKQKQVPMQRAAEHELQMAQEELREAEAKVRSDVARLAAEWRRSEEQIRLYREAIIPQTAAALDAARVSYLAGTGDYSTVIEDFNLWLDARVELVRREAERFVTWAEIHTLVTSSVSEPAQGENKP